MVIVGELINATRKSIKEFLSSKNGEAIRRLAVDQIDAGADFVDINGAISLEGESEYLKWLIDEILAVIDVPLCIDSASARIIEEMLPYIMERSMKIPMINSISLEKERFENLGPILAGTELKVIALCMSDDGLPETADQRLRIADKLINGLVNRGVHLENIFVDPLVQSIATNRIFGVEFLKSIERIKREFPGVHTMCGLSNVSFGLPVRKRLNQAFMILAIGRGLDGAIVNPLDKKMMANIITAETLMGKDPYCADFLKAYRAGKFAVE